MSVSTDRHQSSPARQQHDYLWDNVNNWEVQKADLACYKGREEVGGTTRLLPSVIQAVSFE